MSLVLIVDDNAAFRDVARRVLGEWGHEVIEASCAVQAVARARQDRPDMALVDIGLPDGDGFELTTRLLEVSSETKVVLLSTDSDRGNSFAGARAGAIGFFPKDELLSDALRDVVDQT